jgi:membrane protease subunit HflC
MSSRAFPIVIVLAAVFLICVTSLFSVRETQLALRTAFGAIEESNYKPGLHFKRPWDRIVRFEKRIMSQSHTGETFLTNDNRALVVDFYIKWRVRNPSTYYQATGGREEIAGERLSEIVKDGIKSVMAQRTLEQIVSAERAAVTGDMFGRASESVEGLGIQLIDVRVQSIDLPDEVSTRVYESMKQNFAGIATRLRGEGSSAAERIKASAERERTEIKSQAERDALRVRGEADATAADIYAKAYSRNPEFYAFYRSLQAYERSIGKEGDVLVVTPDGDFFKYLKNAGK